MTSGHQPGAPLGRLAAIDVGTNSIRLIVVEVAADRTYRILDDEKVVARLGRGLSARDAMNDECMAEAATMIDHLRGIAEGYGVCELRAAATWAVREASNGPAFVELVRKNAGVELEVLSARQEARLGFLGVRHAFDLSSMAVAVMDTGGGSTEVVLGTGEVIDRIYPMPLGSIGLTERFRLDRTTRSAPYKEMRRYVRRRLDAEVGKPPFYPHLLIGIGGTFNTLAAISMHHGSDGRRAVLPFTVRGYELQQAEVRHILRQLRKMPVRERSRVPGLSPDRADIIVAGLSIVESVLQHFKINRVRVADQGIRAGLIRELIDRRWPGPVECNAATVDRMRSVRHFATACRYEDHHAEHVARLAGQLFDQLAAVHAADNGSWVTPVNRELLEAAALLHDVGYLVNYSKHHKHSYHLIVHSDLPGFTHREIDVIANVARYHRGASPKSKHSNFSRLSSEDQDLVRRLAGILRLAVGLDRSHTQDIRSVRVRSSGDTIVIDVEAGGHPVVDLWAGERKRGLFESAFGREVRLAWVRAPESALS